MPVYKKPTSTIILELGFNPESDTMHWIANTCAMHMDKYVPYDSGVLSQYDVEGNTIIYDQAYAEYQYKGMREDGTHVINPANRNRDYHPLATSYWDKKMVSAEMPDIVKEVQKYINHH